MRILSLSLSIALSLSACDGGPPDVVDAGPLDFIERDDDVRAPLGLECDPLDGHRCLLPWPSNAFAVPDGATATGLRLAVNGGSVSRRDDGATLARADGFSRVSSIVVGFDVPLAEDSLAAATTLLVAGGPDRGRSIPIAVETRAIEDGQALLIANPSQVLAAATDHVAIVTDVLESADGSPLEPTRGVQVALGLEPPRTEEEALIAGYHAPTRRLLAEQGIDPASVLRITEWTTRSAANATGVLEVVREACLDAVELGELEVVFDSVEVPEGEGPVALIALGRLRGLPSFFIDEEGIATDDADRPIAVGTRDAPFRILVPAGEGDYPFVVFGHGTGGSEDETLFDADIGGTGLGKLSVRFYGWAEEDVVLTFVGLERPFAGSYEAASHLVEALAHAAALERAMAGVLGDALAAETIGEVPNPAAGRRPETSRTLFVGGSLGGTMGLVYGALDPNIRHAVLNVPGAAWTQWVWHSSTFDLLGGPFGRRFRDALDFSLAIAISQTHFDLVDGASFVDALEANPTSFLIQMSIGDPILPNRGSDMVAIVAGAQMVGEALSPIEGVSLAEGPVIEGSGVTQFYAPEDGSEFAIHGFADRNTPAGDAARDQIRAFIESALEGESRIEVPALCPEGRCDFR